VLVVTFQFSSNANVFRQSKLRIIFFTGIIWS